MGAAVRLKDIAAVVANHTEDLVMFNVPPPFRSAGLGGYRATWDTFYRWSRDAGVFDIIDLTVIAADHAVFAYASMRCAGFATDGAPEDSEIRDLENAGRCPVQGRRQWST
jgi:ketosteroid isomerase-like protein